MKIAVTLLLAAFDIFLALPFFVGLVDGFTGKYPKGFYPYCERLAR